MNLSSYRAMLNFSLYLLVFLTLFLGDDVAGLQASQNVNKNFQATHSSSPDQPYRTGYHFQPPKNWMNDPNGPMIYKGIYHFFYQHNPKGPVWKENLVWGHSTSTDLINWNPHDPAIIPSQPSDIKGVWSGSATILPGGKPIILYTGIDQNNRQVQNLAVPQNLSDPYLKQWIKTPKNPVISPTDQIDPSLFRDPSTAWLGPVNIWRVIIGSQIKDKGLAILYKSKDFMHWTKSEMPLHSAEHSGMWECLDFFAVSTNSLQGVNDNLSIVEKKKVRHVLKASLFSTWHDVYTIGTYNVTVDEYIPDEGVMNDSGIRYDYGKFYASKTFYDSAKNRRILWGWVNESSSKEDDIKKGWSGLQAVPRSLWLDKSGKQLIQWPIAEIKRLRRDPAKLQNKFLQEGSLHKVTRITAAQADIEVAFETTELQKAEVLDPNQTNPQLLCNQKGASVKGSVGPFGLLTLASPDLQEYTAVFFRIFKGQQHKYAVLMCSDQSRSSLNNNNDKTTYGAFLNVDPIHAKLKLRSLIDHSIVESFGGGGRACMTARVYPSLAINDEAQLYVFNNGTQSIKIKSLRAWSMQKAHIN